MGLVKGFHGNNIIVLQGMATSLRKTFELRQDGLSNPPWRVGRGLRLRPFENRAQADVHVCVSGFHGCEMGS